MNDRKKEMYCSNNQSPLLLFREYFSLKKRINSYILCTHRNKITKFISKRNRITFFSAHLFQRCRSAVCQDGRVNEVSDTCIRLDFSNFDFLSALHIRSFKLCREKRTKCKNKIRVSITPPSAGSMGEPQA